MNAEKRGSFAVLSGTILEQALRLRSGRIPQPRSGDLGDQRGAHSAASRSGDLGDQRAHRPFECGSQGGVYW